MNLKHFAIALIAAHQPALREVQARERAVMLLCSLIVGACCLLWRVMDAQIKLGAIGPDVRTPALATAGPFDALVSAGVRNALRRVLAVLRASRFSEVLLSIIEPVAVFVVNVFAAQDQSMHQPNVAIAGIKAAAAPRANGGPVKLGQPGEVLSVNDRVLASRQRNQANRGIGWLRNCMSGLGIFRHAAYFTTAGCLALLLLAPAVRSQGQNFPSSSSSASSVGAIFSVLNYGWVDDDATDNCGSPVTNFMAAVNGYTGAGIAQALIPEGTAGKAYKLNSCNLVFTIPTTIMLRGTLDCGTGVTTAFCIQLGPSGLVAFTNAQTPPYTLEGTGVVNGCLNVTTACIGASLWVSNPRILRIHGANVGAGNASPPACTNYFISFEGHNNAPQIIDTEYWDTDGTTGRCWSINNRTAAAGGTNSALIEHNTVIGAGAAPGFTTPCGSVGHSELGSATIITGNQFYGFGESILLVNPMFDVMIETNQVDQAGCTTNVASADIQYGSAANGLVSGVNITGNYFANHATSAISVANGSSSVLQGLTFQQNETGSPKNIFPSALPPACSDCYTGFNPGFNASSTTTTMAFPVWTAGASAATQTANVAPTTAYTAANAAVYRATCYVVLTQPATTSSTLPSCSFKFTDFQTSVVGTLRAAITWAAGASCTGSATNTVGNSCQGTVDFVAKSATAIQFCTGVTGCDTNGTDYTSVGGTAMQYTAFARVERLN